MAFDGQGDIYIPMDVFIKMLLDHLGQPDLLKDGGEFRFGQIRMDGEDIAIPWAYSEYTPPEEWGVKPKAVTDWESDT